METILNILLITIIIVFIIDCTDFILTLKIKLWNWTFNYSKPYKEYSIKPFDCSLCLSWWCNIIVLLVTNNFTIPYITVVAISSFLTPVFHSLLMLVYDILVNLINWVYKVLKIN